MYPETKKVRWIDMYRSGSSTKKIAADEGVAARTVLLYLRNQGVTIRRPGRPSEGLSKKQVAQRWLLKKKYGLTQAQYNELLERQNGCCAICAKPPDGVDGNGLVLHVDHDHVSGKVRGLLCRKCNPALGAFGDDPALLRRAAEYLEQNR